MKVTASDIQRLAQSDPDSIAKVVNESEEAKQLLRAAGFGVMGQGIRETVREALQEIEEYKEQ